ncbi:MAG: IS4 family transposase, partial [Desulfobacteraceae bacterium]|nr:IS4 family transposase [Desulfobacteraceae bacterium]
MTNRREKLRVKQQRSRITKLAERADAVSIFNILTSPELFEVVESHLPVHRERQFPPTVTLAMFINQVLGEDGSMQQAVNQWAVQMATEGLTGVSTNTGAYCRARQRLDLSLIKTLCQETGRLLHEAAEPAWCWRGRNVKLVDGTGLSMPDTVANQARYPQPSSQAEGVGFPHIRMVGVTCLAT